MTAKRKPKPKLKPRLLPSLIQPAKRNASSPAMNVATGTISAGLGLTAATLLAGSVPVLAPATLPLAALLTGIFAGIGNRVRTGTGWRWFPL